MRKLSKNEIRILENVIKSGYDIIEVCGPTERFPIKEDELGALVVPTSDTDMKKAYGDVYWNKEQKVFVYKILADKPGDQCEITLMKHLIKGG